MRLARTSILVVIVALAFFALIAALARSAQSHSWYDGSCCSEFDCRQTELGEIERHSDGWFVVSTKELIPFDDKRIKRSLDPLVHVCLRAADISGARKVRCLYIPEMPV